jgi:GTPase SAR1 family protein
MAVGKTHLLERYRTGKLPEAQQPTIGVELVSKVVQLKDNKGAVRAQIWDTAG